ncbi:MAG: hypothetical protein IPH04_09025 [Saprospirales bacterium]|nr:hypothetical protein [Saprospirales bacterium]
MHIIREDDGSGGMSPDLVIPGIDTLNAFFAQTNLQFSLCGGPNFIDSSDFYDLPYDTVSQGKWSCHLGDGSKQRAGRGKHFCCQFL